MDVSIPTIFDTPDEPNHATQPDEPTDDPAATMRGSGPLQTVRLAVRSNIDKLNLRNVTQDLRLLNRYCDLLFITGCMAVIETHDKKVLMGFSLTFVLITSLTVWHKSGPFMLIVFLIFVIAMGLKLYYSTMAIEEVCPQRGTAIPYYSLHLTDWRVCHVPRWRSIKRNSKPRTRGCWGI